MTYVLVIRPARAGCPQDATDAEKDAVGRHFQFLKAAHEAGRVSFVGRCEDAAFGLVIFEAEDDASAKSWALKDPAVAAGVFTNEVRPFRVVFPAKG